MIVHRGTVQSCSDGIFVHKNTFLFGNECVFNKKYYAFISFVYKWKQFFSSFLKLLCWFCLNKKVSRQWASSLESVMISKSAWLYTIYYNGLCKLSANELPPFESCDFRIATIWFIFDSDSLLVSGQKLNNFILCILLFCLWLFCAQKLMPLIKSILSCT